MVQVLSRGSVNTLTQNVVYAMPGEPSYISFFNDLEMSTEVGFTNIAPIAVADWGNNFLGAFKFVRCTTANAVVSVARL